MTFQTGNSLVQDSDAPDSGYDPDVVRDKIVQAAAECFERYGLQRTIMEDVARAAGVSRGTVYNHFKDKAGLLGAYMSMESRKTVAAAQERLDYSLPSSDLLAHALLALVESSVAQDILLGPDASGITAASLAESPLGAEKVREFWHSLFDLVEERGDLRDDLDREELARRLVFIQFVLNMRRSTLADTSEGVVSYLEEFLTRPLLKS